MKIYFVQTRTKLTEMFLIKNLTYSTAPTPSFEITYEADYNYLCTYDLNSPLHNVLDACISITWEVGGGWALEFESFWAL
jgi:hypothetical protein